MKTKLLSSLLIAVATVFAAHSATLTPDQALSRLQSSPECKTVMASGKAAAQPRLVYTAENAGRPLLYLFNKSGNNGFMILPADDAVGSTLLGYTEEGSFDPAKASPEFIWWLGQYEAEITWVIDHATASTSSDAPASQRAEIAPILQTYWNQLEPYNDLCPEYEGSRCPSGCVATALTQVMKHWNYPARGRGQNTYVPSEYINYELSLDLSDIEFEWDKMLPRYDANSPAEANKAIATLTYACGVAVSMAYGPEASSASYSESALSLIRNFGYDESMRLLKRDYFGVDEWTEMVYNELAAGRPVLYGGGNDNVAHAFVCDGYRSDGYFHINWGWGGWQDGYFKLTALNPSQSGVGGAAGGYNIEQEAVIGARPYAGNIEIVPVVEFASDFMLDKTEYSRDSQELIEVSDTVGIANSTLSEVNLRLGLKLVGSDGVTTYIPSDETYRLAFGDSIKNYSVKASELPATGEYRVTPAVKIVGGEWTDAYVMLDRVRAYNLKASNGRLTFSPVGVPNVVLDSLKVTTSIYPGRECRIRAYLTNLGQEEYYERLAPVLIGENGAMDEAGGTMIDLLKGESCHAEWISIFSEDLVPGNYSLALMDGYGRIIGEQLPVVVKEAPTETPEPYIVQAVINGRGVLDSTLESPVLAQLNDFKLTFTVGNRAGYFTDVVNGAVWYSETVGVRGLGGGFVGIDAGQTAEITVIRNLSELDPNHVYYLYLKGQETGVIGGPYFFKADPDSGIENVTADNHNVMVTTDGLTAWVMTDLEVSGMTLYDAAGMPVAQANGNGVDVSDVAGGFYLVRVAMADGSVVAAKLLINR